MEQRRALLERIAHYRQTLVVGPHGTGKTTLVQSLLPSLRQQFPGVATVRLSRPLATGPISRRRQARSSARQVRGRQDALPRHGLLIVDGLEQLSSLARWRMLWVATRRRHLVLATSHRTLAGFTEVHRTRVTGRLIESLAESLLADASPSVVAAVYRELSGRDLDGIGNVRDLWFELYDVVAKMGPEPPGGAAAAAPTTGGSLAV